MNVGRGIGGSCLTCIHADWDRNKKGHLHPNGNGRCEWKFPEPVIAKAYHWIYNVAPSPYGGHIDRREPHEDCPQWHPAKKEFTDT